MPRKIEQTGTNGKQFECLVPDNLAELYIDGVSELQVGIPNSRVLFHAVQVPGGEAEKERRIARLSLVLPTQVLFELVANIAEGSKKEVVENTSNGISVFGASLLEQVNRLHAMSLAVTPAAD